MERETNDDKYRREIPQYQREAEKYFWLSVPLAALTAYFMIDGLASGIPDINPDKAMFYIKVALSIFVWHQVFSGAEEKVSKMKQSIRDYCHDKDELRSPVKYNWTTKVVQKLMLLYDNSSLPPDKE